MKIAHLPVHYLLVVLAFGHGLSGPSLAEETAVVEAVKYRLKPGELEAFPLNRKAGLEQIASYPGFISAWTYQSVEDPAVIFDYVLWKSLEDAQSAAALVVQAPEASGMMGAIESILYASHFRSTTPSTPIEPTSTQRFASLSTLSIPGSENTAMELRCEATAQSMLYVSLEEGFNNKSDVDYLYMHLLDDTGATASRSCELPLANRNTQAYRQYEDVISRR